MAQLGTLSIDFLVNLQNSLNQVGQLENRIAELERTARDSRRAVDDIGNARVGNIAGAFDDAAGAIDRFRGGLSGVVSGQGGIGDLIGAFKGIPPQALLAAGSVIAITGAVAGLGIAITSSINSLRAQTAEMSSGAKETGVAFQAYQDLAGAAKLAGVDIDAMKDGLKEINATLGDGAESEKAKLFQQLGVSILDASGKMKSADQILMESADAFKAMGSDTERSVMALKLFGEEAGPKLAPMLKQGQAGIQGLIEENRELNGVISNETAKSVKGFEDGLKRLNTVVEGAKNAFGAIFMPAATLVVEVFLELAKAIKGALPEGQSFQDLVLDITKSGLRLLLQAIDAGIKKINQFGRVLIVAAPALVMIYNNVMLTVDGLRILINALDIFKAFVQTTVLVVVGALIDAFGSLVGAMGDVASAVGLDSVAEGAKTAQTSIQAMSAAIGSINRDAIAGMKTDFNDILDTTGDIGDRTKNIGSNIKGLQGVGQGIADFGVPLQGANDALIGALKENTESNKKNTEGALDLKKVLGEDKEKKEKAAKKEKESKISELMQFQRLIGPGASEELYKEDPKYKEIIDKAVKDQSEIEKKNKAETERLNKLLKARSGAAEKYNKTVGDILETQRTIESAHEYVAEVDRREAERNANHANNREQWLSETEKIDKNLAEVKSKGYKQEVEFYEARAEVIEGIDKTIGQIPVIGKQLANVAEGLFRGGNVLRDAASKVGIGQPRRKGEIAESRAKAGVLKGRLERRKSIDEQETEELRLRNDVQRQQGVDALDAALQKEKELFDLRKQQSKQFEQFSKAEVAAIQSIIKLTKDLGAAQANIVVSRAQEMAHRLAAEKAMGMELANLVLANQIIHEKNELTRLKLQLDEADAEYAFEIQKLNMQNLTGLRLTIEQQKLRNEYEAKVLGIKKEITAEEEKAAERGKTILQQTIEKAQKLTHANEAAKQGLEIERINGELIKNGTSLESYALQITKANLEAKLKEQELNLQNLTPLEKELEMLKIKNELLEKTNSLEDERGQKIMENIEKSLSGGSAVAGGLGDLIAKIGGDEKADDLGFQDMLRQIDNVSGALGGLGQSAAGVARIMAGDLIGGITGLITGLMSTVGSVYDFFFGESEEEKKAREEREKREEEARFEDVSQIFFDNAALRQQAEEFAKAFVTEQEKRMGRPVEITIDARGALIGEENEVARALSNLLETELGRRVGNVGIGRL